MPVSRAVESPVIADPEMAALPDFLDARLLNAQLGEFLPGGQTGLEVQHVQLLRYHPGKRCVVEVTLRSAEGSLSLIGKLYAKDRSHVYHLMDALRRSGFGPHDRFSIPQPMVYLQPLNLLFQEKVEGRPATEWFLSDEAADRAAAAERCAAWLVRFHAMALQEGARFDPDSHLLAMEQWSARLASSDAPIAESARALFERLKAAAPELPPAELCTIHGDYSHHQVILSPDRTATIDWDRYRLADPAQDAARFAVGLQRLALRRRGSIRGLDGPANVFLEAYLASAPPGVAARVAFHRAAICLEHAKHDVHKQAEGWPERAAATLAEGVRVLMEGR